MRGRISAFFSTWFLCLALTPTAWADVIRWELDGVFATGGKVDGGFDYDLSTGQISNISVFTTFALSCRICINDYSDARGLTNPTLGDGVAFEDAIEYLDEFSGKVLRDHHVLNWHGFNINTPGTYTGQEFSEVANVRVDPTDVNSGLYGDRREGSIKGIAIGTIITTPIPEPETYALMLSGLGLVGATLKRRRRSHIG